MPEWEQIQPEDTNKLRIGQKVRAYKGDFTRAEGVVKQDDEGDLYATGIGYFTNESEIESDSTWTKNWDKLEIHHLAPTEPGYYVGYIRGQPKKVIVKTLNENWNIDGVAYYIDDERVLAYLPFKRLIFDTDYEPPVDEPQDEE